MKRRTHPTPRTRAAGRYQQKQAERSTLGAAIADARRRHPQWQPRRQ
jgi:hypothetical protein